MNYQDRVERARLRNKLRERLDAMMVAEEKGDGLLVLTIADSISDGAYDLLKHAKEHLEL